jgi:hypothetical protein
MNQSKRQMNCQPDACLIHLSSFILPGVRAAREFGANKNLLRKKAGSRLLDDHLTQFPQRAGSIPPPRTFALFFALERAPT